MATPELRWPITPATFASANFCAMIGPLLGLPSSSSESISNFTGWPPMVMPFALASSTARRTPDSLSLPRCAMPPVSGAAWPILTVTPAGVVAPPVAGASSFLPHPASDRAAMATTMGARRTVFCRRAMGSPRKGRRMAEWRGIIPCHPHPVNSTQAPATKRKSRREAGFQGVGAVPPT